MIGRDSFLEKLRSLVNSTKIPILTKGKNERKGLYYNIPSAFDIETTSIIENGEKRAIMYIWQFGILDWVTYGRTWEEFIVLLSDVTEILNEATLVIYVHNLQFEFQFIRKLFNWTEVFAVDNRKPATCKTDMGIEFRCSLILAGGKSLSNVGKDLQRYKVKKLVGDLDYSLPRHALTELSPTELRYCENDIRVLLSYVQEKIEDDGGITKIPPTNTGYVRLRVREECHRNYERYHNIIKSLILSSEEYKMLKDGYAGGFTHANANYVRQCVNGKTIHNVTSYDFTSSYPAVMVLEKFPMSAGVEVQPNDYEEFRTYLNNYCCLVDLTIYHLEPKLHFEHPISVSKCFELEGEVTDNGRVVRADHLRTVITELDWKTITEFYTAEDFEINMMIVYEKRYLPKSFIHSILTMYKDKTTLKGVEGAEVNYMIAKNMLNSCYGMTVTDLYRPDIKFVNGVQEPFELTQPDLDEVIKKYNNDAKRFLFYPWGVWVCAHARRNLFTGILECREDYVYSDTDSIKIVNAEKHLDYIKAYNANVEKKIDLVCSRLNLDRSLFSPKTIKGEVKTIGMWDYDGFYDEFKTLGAKRYMYRQGDHYSLTVAGLHKKKGTEWIIATAEKMGCSPFDLFKFGMKVPPEYSGRLDHSYVDEPKDGILVDYTGVPCEYHEESAVCLTPSDYTMTNGIEYDTFLRFYEGDVKIES